MEWLRLKIFWKEIVGDIRDEGDEEKSPITQTKGQELWGGRQRGIVDFNRHFNTALPEDDPYDKHQRLYWTGLKNSRSWHHNNYWRV